MEKNKIIIIALVVLIVALAVGVALSFNVTKENTKLEITSNKTLTEGGFVMIRLTDINSKPIANQTVNITLTDTYGNSSVYSVVTNEKGLGKLNLDNGVGGYDISCSYGGNDKYNASSTSDKLSIKKEVVQAETSSSNNDPGAFYSRQSNKMIYTGDIQEAPDGHAYRHLGYNQWEQVR